MSERAVLGSFWPLQPRLLQHGGTAVVNITITSERLVEPISVACQTGSVDGQG